MAANAVAHHHPLLEGQARDHQRYCFLYNTKPTWDKDAKGDGVIITLETAASS